MSLWMAALWVAGAVVGVFVHCCLYIEMMKQNDETYSSLMNERSFLHEKWWE